MAVAMTGHTADRGTFDDGRRRSRPWPAAGRALADRVAMREKDSGSGSEYTWARRGTSSLDAAHGLLALGVDAGDRVSIHSEDRPEWVMLDLATVAVRGVTVGLYPTNPTAEVEYLLGDSGPASTWPRNRSRSTRRSRSTAGTSRTAHDHSSSPAAARLRRPPPDVLGRLPRARAPPPGRASPGAVERRMAAAEADDVMTLVYTSGTTGPPKGAMLTNANAAFAIEAIGRRPGAAPGRQAAEPGRPDPHLPPAVPRGRAHLLDLAPGRRAARCSTSPSRSRRSREPPRDAADAVLRRPPDLGEAPRRRADQGQRRLLVQAQDARVRPAAGPVIGRAQVANGGNHTCRSRLLTPSGSRSYSGRCRSGSACAVAGRPARAPRRSHPRCSSSSWASACRSSSCTA